MRKEHGDVELVAVVRFEMGEGLQKRQDNFAEEVMGQMKKYDMILKGTPFRCSFFVI